MSEFRFLKDLQNQVEVANVAMIFATWLQFLLHDASIHATLGSQVCEVFFWACNLIYVGGLLVEVFRRFGSNAQMARAILSLVYPCQINPMFKSDGVALTTIFIYPILVILNA